MTDAEIDLAHPSPEPKPLARVYGEALNVFEFSTFFGDYRSAAVVLNLLETRFRASAPAGEVRRDIAYRDAIRAPSRRRLRLSAGPVRERNRRPHGQRPRPFCAGPADRVDTQRRQAR